jgi:arylsulfatase
VRPVTIQRQRRTALYTHCPAEVRLADVTIPPDGRFHAGLGHIIPRHSFSGDKRRGHTTAADTESTTVGRARFEVVLDVGGESRTVIDQQVSPAEGWIDVHATLAEWAGLTATIILRTSSDSPDAIALWASPTIFQPDASAPFVVIYLIDALSALHLDLYGYTRPTMPALRRLAEGGTWLANMFSNSSRTIESIPDLMLSLPAELHGVISPSIAAPPALVTIADAFRAAGYATASFCTNVNAGPQQNMDQGFDVFVDRIDSWRDGSANRTVPLENVQLWMAANRDRPMFAYIHTAEPHAPYTPINGFAGRFSSAHPGEIDGTYDEKTGFRSATTQEQRDRVMALYDDEVAYADSRLGEFLAAVDAAGLRERLTILVIADHGEEFQQHGGWEHGTNLHTEQTRIPLVVHSPLFPPRGRIDTAAQMVDLMPTLLDLFGLPQPYPLAGRSLRPLLHPDGDDDAAQQLAQRTLYLSNFRYKVFGWVEFALIEAGRWKLILRSNEHGYKSGGELTRFALFDIQADPGETRNLLDEQRDLARRLIDQLVAYARSQRPFSAGPAQPIQYDTKQIRELQSLGYVGQE